MNELVAPSGRALQSPRSASTPSLWLVAALLFVTLHFEPTNLVASLCLGVGTGLCAIQSRSIVPGLIVHIASNAFGMWYATLVS